MGVALLLPAQTALKLCVSALEKYPDSALLKALKSVALMRTGRQAEAHKVGVEVHGVCSGAVAQLSTGIAIISAAQCHGQKTTLSPSVPFPASGEFPQR